MISREAIHQGHYAALREPKDSIEMQTKIRHSDGTSLKTYSRTMLPLNLGVKSYLLAPYIGDISDAGILGLDFLRLYGGSIDGKTGILTIRHPSLQTIQCHQKPIGVKVYNRYTVRIPGGEMASIILQITELQASHGLMIDPEPGKLKHKGQKKNRKQKNCRNI